MTKSDSWDGRAATAIPSRGPFDLLSRAWSRDAQVCARRANRRAFWWISNLWCTPHHVFRVLGAIVAILLLIESGAVRGGLCLSGAGCVSWGEEGIVATSREQVVIRAP